MDTLSPLVGKRQYLITYSQANLNLFPTRESFGSAVAEEFNSGTSAVKVDYWACCKELHKDGGIHFHCSIKLTGSKKWIGVRNRLSSKYNIQVNFSDKHDYYLSSYRYVCKEDEEVFHSENHPENLLSASSPATKKGTLVSKQNARKRKSLKLENEASLSKKRMNNLEASDIIKKEKIKSYTELLALAEKRREAGQTDFANFVFNRNEKALRELVKKTWDMSEAQSTLEVEKTSRIDMLYSYMEREPCGEPCDGKWFECANEILELNKIPVSEFALSVYDLIEKGRGKHRNIIITGPANCGKTFILKPLQIIFKNQIFQNPANDKYGWLGADKAKVILLNDFRWTKELIPWKDLLLLLEGEPVHLPSPKNLYSQDVKINTDVPVFATSKGTVKYKGSYGTADEREDKMMEVRWKEFKFYHQFEEKDQKNIDPCPKCFCRLVFSRQ